MGGSSQTADPARSSRRPLSCWPTSLCGSRLVRPYRGLYHSARDLV